MDVVYKVIVIGDPMVGKSSLLAKYATTKFDDVYLPTIGANITKQLVEVDGGVISLLLWDIAGQKDFYEIYKSYFNGANGIIIVYDITRSATFEHIENWYQECLNNGIAHAPIIVVGNKIDVLDKRAVTVESAMEKADMLNAQYFESSAKTGENVKNIFESSALSVYEGVEKR